MTTRKFTQTLLSTLLLTAAGGASAAAFQLAEISTSGLGRAYAGEAAIADNAAVVATNPALMSLFKQNEFSAGGVYVDSRIHINGPVTAYIRGQKVASGSANAHSVVPGAFIPNMYFISPINDKFTLGAGMNVNFGLKSEYSRDYDAGIFGGITDLTAISLNLSGSYRITNNLTAGFGLNGVYAKAELDRTAGIAITGVKNALNSMGEDNVKRLLSARIRAKNPTIPQAIADGLAQRTINNLKNLDKADSLVHLRDNAWGFGWNTGLVYEFDQDNRLGLAYHSKVDIDFKDRNALSLQQHNGVLGPYIGKGSLTLKLPAYWELSGFHQLTDQWAIHYSYKYTEWSRFKELRGKYQDGSGYEAFTKKEEYKDNSRFAIGTTYSLNDALTLRAGLAYDKAASKTHLSASIPDTDRMWYSIGATYKFTPNLSVDVGFAHLRGKKKHFVETQNIKGLLLVEADYTTKATANLYGLNLNYRF
ncbi:outer membrane protein transport protein [Aggregatibacter actinomycetemcomitans]|uniref:outer membrane protein transport protein n=1 Tax=Aggregatibacter actinomycetemcomitans TaxID=714 RepID=UPI00043762C5|nr:outer membrane protein transport protein [Aggregatibacter actinomycetemcomitans]AHN72478.1 outer membrane protein P1 precursor, putative [Aggregatibacter actinomycetemcomitans HK1651]QPQ81264.1 outer membrane protein transport protein [Aggregatibacter actinomycetemcomitans]